ncbi:MAG TPA: hypothetical protein VE224_12560 [Pseudolabrys sp.]|nr:hypothetical protein [Pseudolabrys sp.]
MTSAAHANAADETAAKADAANEMAAIEDLVSDLDKRLRRLSSTARGEAVGAAGDVREFVNDTLSGVMGRVRNSAATMGRSAVQESSRVSNDALTRLIDEVEQRPLLMLGLAAGLGFLVGMSSRR